MKTTNSCLWRMLLFSGGGTPIAVGLWLFEYLFYRNDNTPNEYDDGYEDGYDDGVSDGFENRDDYL